MSNTLNVCDAAPGSHVQLDGFTGRTFVVSAETTASGDYLLVDIDDGYTMKVNRERQVTPAGAAPIDPNELDYTQFDGEGLALLVANAAQQLNRRTTLPDLDDGDRSHIRSALAELAQWNVRQR